MSYGNGLVLEFFFRPAALVMGHTKVLQLLFCLRTGTPGLEPLRINLIFGDLSKPYPWIVLKNTRHITDKFCRIHLLLDVWSHEQVWFRLGIHQNTNFPT